MALVPDNRIYGLNDEDFKRTVYAWCDEINGDKIGYYKLAKGLYQDNFKRIDTGDQRFNDETYDDPYQDYRKNTYQKKKND